MYTRESTARTCSPVSRKIAKSALSYINQLAWLDYSVGEDRVAKLAA